MFDLHCDWLFVLQKINQNCQLCGQLLFLCSKWSPRVSCFDFRAFIDLVSLDYMYMWYDCSKTKNIRAWFLRNASAIALFRIPQCNLPFSYQFAQLIAGFFENIFKRKLPSLKILFSLYYRSWEKFVWSHYLGKQTLGEDMTLVHKNKFVNCLLIV